MKSISLVILLCVPSVLAIAVPTPPSDVVFKPTFLTGYTSLTAGTGFVARLKDQAVFLTAHHLFGPAAGLERDLTPVEAKDFASGLAASSMNHLSKLLASSEMLLIPSAKAFDRTDTGHDVAAFRLAGYQGPSLVVSDVAPKKGDKVYLLARPRGEEQLRLISAVISRMSPTAIEYFYDEAGVNFGGTSGAPLLNESGEVVGLNLGGGALRGKEFGFGNPATSFAALVSAAVESNQRHATDRDALGKTMAAILKGFAEGDVDTVMLYHHPDVAKALSYTKTLTGRDAVKADLAGTFQSFRLEFVEHHLESLLVQDDYAVEQTTFAIKGTPKAGGESWIFRGRALVVYVRYVGSPTGWASLREMIQPATE